MAADCDGLNWILNLQCARWHAYVTNVFRCGESSTCAAGNQLRSAIREVAGPCAGLALPLGHASPAQSLVLAAALAFGVAPCLALTFWLSCRLLRRLLRWLLGLRCVLRLPANFVR